MINQEKVETLIFPPSFIILRFLTSIFVQTGTRNRQKEQKKKFID